MRAICSVCALVLLAVLAAAEELDVKQTLKSTGSCKKNKPKLSIKRMGDGYLLSLKKLGTAKVIVWSVGDYSNILPADDTFKVEPSDCDGTQYSVELACGNSGTATISVILTPVPLDQLIGQTEKQYDVITSYKGDEASSVTLRCQDTSLPPYDKYSFTPIYKWGRAAEYTGGKFGALIEPEVETNEFVIDNLKCGDAGFYNCKIRRCPNDPYKETFACNGANVIVQLPKPKTPPPAKCDVYGDPHIRTFDGKHYSYNGRCSYVIAMDGAEYRSCAHDTLLDPMCHNDRLLSHDQVLSLWKTKWFVYGKFNECGDGGSSCLESVYIITRSPEYPGGVYLELMRGFTMNVGGMKKMLRVGESDNIKGIQVTYTGKKLVAVTQYGLTVSWDGLTMVELELPSGQPTRGLCGDNDGVRSNDFNSYFDGVQRDDGAEFGNLWRVGSSKFLRDTGCELGKAANVAAPLTKKTISSPFSFRKLPTLPSSYTKSYCSKVLDNPSALSFLAAALDKDSREAYIEACQADLKAELDDFYSLPTFIRCSSYHALANEAKRHNMCIDRWDIALICPDPQKRREEAVRMGCVWTQLQREALLEIPTPGARYKRDADEKYNDE